MSKKPTNRGWTPGPTSHSRPARVRHGGSINPPPQPGCCAMAAAGRAIRRGKYRLAGRYAALSIRLIAEKVTA